MTDMEAFSFQLAGRQCLACRRRMALTFSMASGGGPNSEDPMHAQVRLTQTSTSCRLSSERCFSKFLTESPRIIVPCFDPNSDK